MLDCKEQEKYTQHQHHIRRKMEKWYGTLTKRRLDQIQTRLKQELKAECYKVRNKRLIQERRRINRLFQVAPKIVYRELKGDKGNKVNEMPSQEGVEEFWKSLWGTPTQHNEEAPWIKELEKEYCTGANQKDYEITDEILDRVLTKLANDKPGRDQVAGVWIKRLTSMKGILKKNLVTMLETDIEPPERLLTSKTILLAKNTETSKTILLAKNTETGDPKNYRPIALQNSMYKIYTAILAEFIMDHCEENNIITLEQAAGKKGNWGYTDQLLINKMVYEEVKSNRCNLATAWLDYKKAFDSVSHIWLIKSLELAKIPVKIIEAIKRLMVKWRTKVFLYGENSDLETSVIEYLQGVLQGDTLSLIVFVLTVNPLSYLLHKEEGYKLGTDKQPDRRQLNLSHLFFVDDLKLYAPNVAKLRRLLEIVTQFSNDVAMQFGVSKCAFQIITRGKREPCNTPITVNNLTLQEIEDGDHYRYLGMEESVGIDGILNKSKAIKEYKTRIRRIWSSELNAANKIIAHNTLATPVISYTIGILPWNKKEIKELDITTRKLLTMKGSFHKASDINRLYTDRKKRGRGLQCMEDLYESRTIKLKEHLEQAAPSHSLLEMVKAHEQEGIMRLGKEFQERIDCLQEHGTVTEKMRKEQERIWTEKVTHGYLQNKVNNDDFIDTKATNKWSELQLSSHLEGYAAAIMEQETSTKETMKRKEKDPEKK